MENYDFGEKTHEYSVKQGKEIPVWVSPKYTQSRKKAIEVIEKYENVSSGDFWILMNETKNGKMAYTGLIISHNACLKINDALPENLKFMPSCMKENQTGYGDSLVYTYINEEQGLYEVGEVSKSNCKNAYPYAMALKRCFDRVVLKNCKLAYDGVYSDSEADEFAERQNGDKDDPKAAETPPPKPPTNTEISRDKTIADIIDLCDKKRYRVSDLCARSRDKTIADIIDLCDKKRYRVSDLCARSGVDKIEDMTNEQLCKWQEWLAAK